MPEVHQFAYGPVSPIISFVLAFAGALLGLGCTARAQVAAQSGRRARWLVLGSISIGGGIWLMHFMAMLGFDVPASPLRYNVLITAASAVLAVVVVGIGMFVVGRGRPSPVKLLFGGIFTGAGIAAMHYTGMAGLRLSGTISYRDGTVVASVLVAVVAATVALWFTLVVRGRWRVGVAAAVMATATTAMHYTGMAAVRVHLTDAAGPVGGVNPILLVLPITVVATAALIGLVFIALQAMSEEEFALVAEFPEPPILPTELIPAGPPHPVSLAEFSNPERPPGSSVLRHR
jgi:NO-binding membrane sensor protein with MHYT domain